MKMSFMLFAFILGSTSQVLAQTEQDQQIFEEKIIALFSAIQNPSDDEKQKLLNSIEPIISAHLEAIGSNDAAASDSQKIVEFIFPVLFRDRETALEILQTLLHNWYWKYDPKMRHSIISHPRCADIFG
jgi:hypothetical protein